MFSGIVEAKGKVLRTQKTPATIVISVNRPQNFNDLQPGHSVCVNGICLTVENFNDLEMQFALGPETIQVTGWDENQLLGYELNLERSLQFGDRLHGHIVTGHVDARVVVKSKKIIGDTVEFRFTYSPEIRKYLVPKGSVTINGVSLTINSVTEEEFSVCIIPETIKQTNLNALSVGDKVNFESDYLIRVWENLRLYGNE